jgi:nitrate reductase gamma subunit
LTLSLGAFHFSITCRFFGFSYLLPSPTSITDVLGPSIDSVLVVLVAILAAILVPALAELPT